MTFAEFCMTGPCLEELEGFRAQRRKDGVWSEEDQADFLKWKDRLMTGKEIPHPSTVDRGWKYQRGKPPKKIMRTA